MLSHIKDINISSPLDLPLNEDNDAEQYLYSTFWFTHGGKGLGICQIILRASDKFEENLKNVETSKELFITSGMSDGVVPWIGVFEQATRFEGIRSL